MDKPDYYKRVNQKHTKNYDYENVFVAVKKKKMGKFESIVA